MREPYCSGWAESHKRERYRLLEEEIHLLREEIRLLKEILESLEPMYRPTVAVTVN
jgi:hypothetical protein